MKPFNWYPLVIQTGMAHFSIMMQRSPNIAHSHLKVTYNIDQTNQPSIDSYDSCVGLQALSWSSRVMQTNESEKW